MLVSLSPGRWRKEGWKFQVILLHSEVRPDSEIWEHVRKGGRKEGRDGRREGRVKQVS